MYSTSSHNICTKVINAGIMLANYSPANFYPHRLRQVHTQTITMNIYQLSKNACTAETIKFSSFPLS